MDEKGIKEEHEQSNLERVSEKFLWSTRYVVLFSVVSSVLASIVLFLVGSYEIAETIFLQVKNLINHQNYHEELLVGIIAGIDLYLISVVLMILVLVYMSFLYQKLILLEKTLILLF